MVSDTDAIKIYRNSPICLIRVIQDNVQLDPVPTPRHQGDALCAHYITKAALLPKVINIRGQSPALREDDPRTPRAVLDRRAAGGHRSWAQSMQLPSFRKIKSGAEPNAIPKGSRCTNRRPEIERMHHPLATNRTSPIRSPQSPRAIGP